MKKRLFSFVLSMVVAMSSVISLSAVTANAATEVVPVYLNEKAITFPANDAQPQIIDNRTYVPIRATCDALGLTIDWNAKTETLTFSREGIVISHTMRSKIVYVNGKANDYDTASINVNNRTLMPIRMLGDSIGATVDWNNDTRSVHITSADTNNEPKAPEGLEISSVKSSKSSAKNGDTVTITVTANSKTDKIKFVDTSSGDTISEVGSYNKDDDGNRTFTVDYDCKNTGDEDVDIKINAIPGTSAGGYNEDAAKGVSITVSSSDSSSKKDKNKDDDEDDTITVDEFESAYFVEMTYDNNIKKGDYCNFTITADSDVKRVKVGCDDEEVVVKDYDEDGDERVFEGKIKMTEEGTRKLKIDAYVKSSYEEIDEAFKVTVKKGSGKNSSSGKGSIIDVEIVNDYFYTGMGSPIYVTTSTDVDSVSITSDDDDDREVGRTSFTTTRTNSEKLWTLNVTVSETGRNRYTVHAISDDEEVDDYSIILNGKKYSKSTPVILSMEQKSSYIKAGEKARFSAKVSGCVTEIEIRRENGNGVIGTATSPASSSTTKNMSVEFEVSNNTDGYYVAYAYNSTGESSIYTFKIAGETYQQLEIIDIDYDDDKKYEVGDRVNVTVTTTNSCEKLWVEGTVDNQRGTKVSMVYTKPDEEDGNQYIWDIQFTPIDENKKSFTIIAQDDNRETDEKSITIRMK